MSQEKSVFLSLGSNVSPRREALRRAVKALLAISSKGEAEASASASFVYETEALLPPGAPPSWDRPFLNMALRIEFSGSPQELLQKTMQIEKDLGRKPGPKWSPRPIDIDILLFREEKISLPHLQIPHPEMEKRAFVMDPLKDLHPRFIPLARKLPERQPIWMAAVNLTPDSFSDPGRFEGQPLSAFTAAMKSLEEGGAHIIDLGAESTRPGARPLASDEERQRLEPFLKALLEKRAPLSALISVDTRHSATARRALSMGACMINDVSGLADPDMLPLLQDSGALFVLTHSLTAPADPGHVLSEDPLKILPSWLDKKLNLLAQKGIDFQRVFFDPGIGFGKTSQQSLRILRHLDVFKSCPVRILVGHSRKSFMRGFAPQAPAERDLETLGLSLRLIQDGSADALRLHRPKMSLRALRGFRALGGF